MSVPHCMRTGRISYRLLLMLYCYSVGFYFSFFNTLPICVRCHSRNIFLARMTNEIVNDSTRCLYFSLFLAPNSTGEVILCLKKKKKITRVLFFVHTGRIRRYYYFVTRRGGINSIASRDTVGSNVFFFFNFIFFTIFIFPVLMFISTGKRSTLVSVSCRAAPGFDNGRIT